MELNKIYNEDCIQGLSKLPDSFCDLVIADPPYMGITKEKWDNQWKNEDEYLDWAMKWIKEVERILKPTGSFYMWGGVGNHENHALIRLILRIKNETNLIRRNWITWKKQRGRAGRNYPFSREECIFYTKSDDYTWNTPYSTELNLPHLRAGKIDYSNGKRRVRKSDYKLAHNVWTDINQVCSYRKQYHPTEKPELACERIIGASSNEGDIVVVPFVGSGSECVSAKKLKRKYIGFEIEPKYVEIAEKRLAEIE